MYELARIVIVRLLDDDGDDVITISMQRPDGDDLPLIEALGLLAFAHADLTAPMILSNLAEEEEEDE